MSENQTNRVHESKKYLCRLAQFQKDVNKSGAGLADIWIRSSERGQ